MKNKLDSIFNNSKRIQIDNNTKLVIMSDCHRGAGDNYDNFIKNQNIFEAALRHYYIDGFTYVELGDGDEMWEVRNYNEIVDEHLDTFKLLKKFNDSNRLIMVYGNHDIAKKSCDVLKKYFYTYCNRDTKEEEKLLNNLVVHEALVLNYNSHDIFMIHGHQVDLLNGTFWRLARFLVRHVWRHFEKYIINNPTSAAKNYIVSKKVEKKLENWSKDNNKMLIAGHTHRPVFPKVGQSLYFNDGSCVHPNGITCLEIENGNITLVRWLFKLNGDQVISVNREILGGKEPIANFFNKK